MTTVDKTNGFGSFLRDQRRAEGISIETIAQKTKIRVEILRHIENEDLGRLPSSTFVKGFVRAYAAAVGADIQEAMRLFEASCVAHDQCDLATAPPKSRAPFWRGLVLSCLVLILLVFITLSIARRMETGPAATPRSEKESSAKTAPIKIPSVAESPAPAAPQSTASALEAEASPAPPQGIPGASPQAGAGGVPQAEAPPTAEDGADEASQPTLGTPQTRPAKLVLQITAVELTWLRVTSDKKVVKEMTLKPDDRMTFEAEERFDLTIGNAGGVQLTLNDQPLNPPGKRGRVVSLKLP
jgi:cytoskeletal protein RodZ